MLNGAAPNTTYAATLHLSTAADTTCLAPFVEATVATLTANAAGNGEVDAVTPPAVIDALGLHNSTVHVYFTLSSEGSVAYATTCQTSRLD